MHSGIGVGLFAVCIVFGVVKLCLQSNVYVELAPCHGFYCFGRGWDFKGWEPF